jgi:hypothetical protein
VDETPEGDIQPMTDNEILVFLLDENPNAAQGDVDAFRRIARTFDVDCNLSTPKEAHESILVSMDILHDDLKDKSQEEQAFILHKRLGGLRGQ